MERQEQAPREIDYAVALKARRIMETSQKSGDAIAINYPDAFAHLMKEIILGEISSDQEGYGAVIHHGILCDYREDPSPQKNRLVVQAPPTGELVMLEDRLARKRPGHSHLNNTQSQIIPLGREPFDESLSQALGEFVYSKNRVQQAAFYWAALHENTEPLTQNMIRIAQSLPRTRNAENALYIHMGKIWAEQRDHLLDTIESSAPPLKSSSDLAAKNPDIPKPYDPSLPDDPTNVVKFRMTRMTPEERRFTDALRRSGLAGKTDVRWTPDTPVITSLADKALWGKDNGSEENQR